MQASVCNINTGDAPLSTRVCHCNAFCKPSQRNQRSRFRALLKVTPLKSSSLPRGHATAFFLSL